MITSGFSRSVIFTVSGLCTLCITVNWLLYGGPHSYLDQQEIMHSSQLLDTTLNMGNFWIISATIFGIIFLMTSSSQEYGKVKSHLIDNNFVCYFDPTFLLFPSRLCVLSFCCPLCFSLFLSRPLATVNILDVFFFPRVLFIQPHYTIAPCFIVCM